MTESDVVANFNKGITGSSVFSAWAGEPGPDERREKKTGCGFGAGRGDDGD